MNLDALCAKCGYEIVQQAASTNGFGAKEKTKLVNTITKSLGVLQEDGVYAFFLFLDYFKSRGESFGCDQVAAQMKSLLRNTQVGVLRNQAANERDDFPPIRDLTENLDHLLLARQLLEQTLIYARYHAKAR